MNGQPITWRFEMFDKNTNNCGWWLKITTFVQLIQYVNATGDKYRRAFENLIKDKAYNQTSVVHGPHLKEAPLAEYAHLYAINHECSHKNALMQISTQQMHNMNTLLEQKGFIHINKNGGFCSHPEKPDAVIHQKELIFPEFKKSDIRISKFPQGHHYYAFVGNVQVKNGDICKWNTYDEAYRQAKQYIKKG